MMIDQDIKIKDKEMLRTYNLLEKNYHFMLKEYDNLCSINIIKNNIINFRIVKNLLTINNLIDQVDKSLLLNIFEENVDNDLLLVLSKNNSNFILKLLAIFYIKLCKQIKFNITNHFNRIFDINKNTSNTSSELKNIPENLFKNSIILISLILFHLPVKLSYHIPSIIDYSKKIRKSDNLELKYFYKKCINSIIKYSKLNVSECDKIFKYLKKSLNDKDFFIQYIALKCLSNLFILHPEYSLLEYEYFINHIIDNININNYVSVVYLKYVIRFVSIIFCNCANVNYYNSKDNDGTNKKHIDDTFLFNLNIMKKKKKKYSDDDIRDEDYIDEKKKSYNDNNNNHNNNLKSDIIENNFNDNNNINYNNNNHRHINNNEEIKKKHYFFSDLLKTATEELVSKISKIKTDEKGGDVESYMKVECIDGFVFQNYNEYNKKILRKMKNVLFIYNFNSFLNYFKSILLNICSDVHHDYNELKKLHFLNILEKFNYYKKESHPFLDKHDYSSFVNKKSYDKKFEFLRNPANANIMNLTYNKETNDYINIILEYENKLMREKEFWLYSELVPLTVEDKNANKFYTTLIRNTLLKIIFFESFKKCILFSKKFSAKSIIKIIEFFIYILDFLCSTCVKNKNVGGVFYTDNISNSFEIKYCIYYFTKIIKQLIKQRKKDTYTVVKEKENKARFEEANKMYPPLEENINKNNDINNDDNIDEDDNMDDDDNMDNIDDEDSIDNSDKVDNDNVDNDNVDNDNVDNIDNINNNDNKDDNGDNICDEKNNIIDKDKIDNVDNSSDSHISNNVQNHSYSSSECEENLSKQNSQLSSTNITNDTHIKEGDEKNEHIYENDSKSNKKNINEYTDNNNNNNNNIKDVNKSKKKKNEPNTKSSNSKTKYNNFFGDYNSFLGMMPFYNKDEKKGNINKDEKKGKINKDEKKGKINKDEKKGKINKDEKKSKKIKKSKSNKSSDKKYDNIKYEEPNKNTSFEERHIRIFLENNVKKYLNLNNDTNLDINEKKKNDIILKALINLYNKVIMNHNINVEKYEKYERFLKLIINNMNGIYIDIDLLKHIIQLFLKVYLKFPCYIYNLITLLVNYITIINANFMTSLTLNTFDDIEKQVSILIISSISLNKILYFSFQHYKIYHLNNLIYCIFDICKLFLSKVQTHPLKTINELRRIISFFLIYSIVFSIVYEVKNNVCYTYQDNKMLAMIDQGADINKNIDINISFNNMIIYEKMKNYFINYEILYNNTLFKLIQDILDVMINEIDEEKIHYFILSYEEQMSKKKMNSYNFFIVDNFFIFIYILKNIYVMLSSHMLTFLFFDHIYNIVSTLFNFFTKINEIRIKYNSKMNKSCSNNKQNIADKGKNNNEKNNNNNNNENNYLDNNIYTLEDIKKHNQIKKKISREQKKRSKKKKTVPNYFKKKSSHFYFYEHGFTQICRSINIENILLIFLIYIVKIFYRINKFILFINKSYHTNENEKVNQLSISYIKSENEKKCSELNYKNNNITLEECNKYKIYLKKENIHNNMNKLFNILEAFTNVNTNDELYFDFFISVLINFVNNKTNFDDLIINTLIKEKCVTKSREKYYLKKKKADQNKYIWGYSKELEILHMLTNNYDTYYDIALISFVYLIELYLKKKKIEKNMKNKKYKNTYIYFNKIMKYIYSWDINKKENKNILILCLYILDNFFNKKCFYKINMKAKFFKSIMPLFNLLSDNFNQQEYYLINFFIIKILTYFIGCNENIDTYIFSYIMKLYETYSSYIIKEKNTDLYIFISILIKNVTLSYHKLKYTNCFNRKKYLKKIKKKKLNYFPGSHNIISNKLRNDHSNLENVDNEEKRICWKCQDNEKYDYINNSQKYDSLLLSMECITTYSNNIYGSVNKKKLPNKEHHQIHSNEQIVELNSKDFKGCTTNNNYNNNNNKLNLSPQAYKNKTKDEILHLFDLYVDILKVIPHNKDIFIRVLKNFSSIIKRIKNHINVVRVEKCLDIVYAYILKRENVNSFIFRLTRGKYIIRLYNNILNILKRIKHENGYKNKMKNNYNINHQHHHNNHNRNNHNHHEYNNYQSTNISKEIDKKLLCILEIFLISYEKKINHNLFKTFNLLFDVIDMIELERYKYIISTIIQKSIFFGNIRILECSIKCLYKLFRKNVIIPLHENFDYYLLIIHNFYNNNKKIYNNIIALLKWRICIYGVFNINQWVKLFENVLSVKNIFIYDIIKFKSKGTFSKFDCKNSGKKHYDQNYMKENNLLTNDTGYVENNNNNINNNDFNNKCNNNNSNNNNNSSSSSTCCGFTFYTSLFDEHYNFNIHINLNKEKIAQNSCMKNNKSKYFFNLFKMRKNDIIFSDNTKYLVMSLLYFFLNRISVSSHIYVHNDSYFSNYMKKVLRDRTILKVERKLASNKSGSVKKIDNLNIKDKQHSNTFNNNNLYSSLNSEEMDKNYHHSNENVIQKINYIELILIDNSNINDYNNEYNKNILIDETNFTKINLDFILDNCTLYTNFELLLKIILNNINYGIKHYRLSRLAIKILIVYLNIFKSSKIIIDEFSSTSNEIKLLTNYEINIFTSLKMYYESFNFMYLNNKKDNSPSHNNNNNNSSSNFNININNYPSGNQNNNNDQNDNHNSSNIIITNNIDGKKKDQIQFSHFFLYPLMDIYNLFLFLNDIKLCNSHNKFVEYFFYFAIKEPNEYRKKKQLTDMQHSENNKLNHNKNLHMNKTNNIYNNVNDLEEVEDKEHFLNSSSLFFSEFDSCVYFLFTYKSFCYYIINNEKCQNNLSQYNLKFIVRNINYILFDSIILYLWSFDYNEQNDNKDLLNYNHHMHKFFTCVNEKSRSLSIFYFNAFPVFIQFLNIIKSYVILNKRNYLLFKIFISFLCYHIRQYHDMLKEETKEIYLKFIYNYLILIEFSYDHDIEQTEEQKSQTNDRINQNEIKNNDCENDENSHNEKDLNICSKSTINNTPNKNKKLKFFKIVLDYILSYLVNFINIKNVANVLEVMQIAHENLFTKEANEIDDNMLCNMFTLNIYIIDKFLNNNYKNEKDVIIHLLWKSFLNSFILLEKMNDLEIKENIKNLLIYLFLKKMNMLNDEKLSSKLLKYAFQYSSIYDLNNYLKQMKNEEKEQIITILFTKDLCKLKLFYIKIIVFIHYVNICENTLDPDTQSYFSQEILQIFINFTRKLKTIYLYNNDIHIKHEDKNLRRQMINSSINIIQNIFTLIKEKDESLIFYFFYNLMNQENMLIPLITTKISMKDSFEYYTFLSAHSYLEDIVCYSIKIVGIFFETFLHKMDLLKKVFIAFVTYIYKMISLCDKGNITITKSFLVYPQEKEERKITKFLKETDYCSTYIFDNPDKFEIISNNNMTIYFKEVIEIFRNMAFKNSNIFKEMILHIGAEEKILIYTLMKESIDTEKKNEEQNEENTEKLDFSFVN
ncbi:putative membrane protein [Plasmodium gaboni]|uniref:Putative membrane protein n=1 Tax=Plasmodium gaboni TaxID=647221 RepID=A0A151LDC4_9APIC|nr:putative membrane protein [Plasmodium gaboni]KYN96939.1 putative membrane protein [Plasmodium gaboni]